MNSIRRAKINDIERILELLVQVDMVHHNGRPDIFKGPATKYTKQELCEIIKNDNTPIFVCVDENDLVLGYTFCVVKQFENDNIMTDIKTLYIDDLCIDEKSRGKHIGKSLYDYVSKFAKDNGFYNITLNVWSLNEGAMKFYEHCGLVPQKITMEKIL